MPDEMKRRIAAKVMHRTAGEVRFIKDRGGDTNEWGWGQVPPSAREITSEYEFNPKNLEPLARILRATLSALGHAQSAHGQFVKLKSARVSPDGALGGKGYIQKIADMRRQYMNTLEALSALSDTLYDELHAPHWDPAASEQGNRERQQVQEIMTDVEEIKKDPEEWAEEEEAEMDQENSGGAKKTAQSIRVAARYMAD